MTSAEVLGRYRLLALLGRGGMASVHLAVSEGPAGFNKLTVIKELLPELAHDPEFLGMFLDEARLAARLRHPSIVQTHDVGQEAGRFFLAMEFLDGQPLSRVTHRLTELGAPLSREHYIRVLMDVLAALDYAHRLCDYDGKPLQIVHRDVSPQNVFITYDGQVKLVDFGIAKAVDSSTETRTGVLKGKVKYMSPEQAAGDKVDARADLFAVGAMLFEAVTGERLWAGMRNVTVVSRLLRGEIPDALEVKPDLPDSLHAILQTALAPELSDRYPTAGAFLNDLEAHLATRPRVHLNQLGERVAGAFDRERKDVQRVIRVGVGSMEAARGGERTGNTPTRAAPHSSLSFSDVTSASSVSSTTPGAVSLTRSHLSSAGARLLAEPRSEAHSLASQARRSRGLVVVGLLVASIGGAAYLGWPSARAKMDAGRTAVDTPAASTVDRCAAADKPLVELTGDIEEDARLECDKDYLLKFQTVIKPGVTLTIERGTRILGDASTKATLVVQPGGKLVARGSREAPVVFSSSKPPAERAAGDWGGVILLGNAPVNLRDERGRPARGQVEGLTRGGAYGGDNPEDNSGVLEYVRIEYSGTALGPGNEINGLTLAGVGRGTLLDHVQVRHTADDCFEFFGGTVDAKHLICQYNGDDGFDWDYGYTGRLQFLVLQQNPNLTGNANGFEGDNDPNSSDNSPRSAPTIYNATLCGNKRASKEQFGMLLRKGTGATIRNTIVTGFDVGLDIRNANTRADISNSIFFGNVIHNVAVPEADKAGDASDDDHGFDEERWLLDAKRQVLTIDPRLDGCFSPVRPVFGPVKSIVDQAADPPKDGFFDVSARFVGACRDAQDDWATAPWTDWEVR